MKSPKTLKKQFLYLIIGIFICTAFIAAQTATSTGPKVILENDKVKVTEYNSSPGKDVCGKGKHSHPAHLTVLLTAAKVKLISADGKTVEQNAPAGTTFWSEAETHTVINNGNKAIKAYIIEIK